MTASKITSNEAGKHLAPSDEVMQTLRSMDFSSFEDSLSQTSFSVQELNTDSDDPFDPDDLVGIMDHNIIKEEPQQEIVLLQGFKENSEMLCLTQNSSVAKPVLESVNEEVVQSSAPLFVASSPLHHRVKTEPLEEKVEIQHSSFFDARLTSSPQKDIHVPVLPILLSPLASPLQAKRPKVSFSPASVRTFHSNAAAQKPAAMPKFEFKKPLGNATIQLATQRPFEPAYEEFDPNIVETKLVRPIILSAEQEKVLRLAAEGKSIFFTGSAGTGKSVLLRAIIKRLKDIHPPGTVAVTASTGLAACNIGGITVHSYTGIGLGKGTVEDILKRVRKNRKAVERWLSTTVLIIDEVSMIEGRLFDKLDWLARVIRKRPNEPFGGIQIIICGDFFQLPPISRLIVNPDGTEEREDTLFAFESMTWTEVLHAKIVLQEVFRQKGDQQFIDMLNEMRRGIVSDETERELMKLSRPLECPAGIVPTELYSTRLEVDNANNIKLNNLPGKSKLYESRDGGTLPPAPRAQMLTNFLAPQKLFLKEKAQVMCIKNFDSNLVNGSLGQVIKFVDRDTYMCQVAMNELPNATLEELKKELIKRKIKREFPPDAPQPDEEMIEQMSQSVASLIPLLDSVFNFLYAGESDSSKSEENPLSDSSTLEEIALVNTKRKMEFLKNLLESARGEQYPLVRFLNPDGVTTRDVLVEPEIWEIKDDKTEEVLVSRVQLPLMLAWALSIHKSQGQTLHRVKINLGRIFENGQAYVALSRAVSRDGLQVLNFRKDKVRAHHGVIDFYESLSSVKKFDEDNES